jgi:hypothetical protein
MVSLWQKILATKAQSHKEKIITEDQVKVEAKVLFIILGKFARLLPGQSSKVLAGKENHNSFS